jgi:hypothetical protein
MIHEFRLSPLGKGGVSCDEGGAFVGAVPVLSRTRGNGRDEWRVRDCDDLSKEMSAQYGLPVGMSSKRGGLRAIANALNEGDMARAQVATLLLRIPNPPSLSKGAPSRQEMIKLAGELHWSGVLKDWDPDQHPRWPAGAPDSQGGQFAPKGDDEIGASPISHGNRTGPDNSRPDGTLADTRIHLADAGVSDASDDPVAQAAARAAEEARRNASAEATPASSEHENFWQRLGSELSDGTKALIAEIGRAQIKQSTADVVTAIGAAGAIAHAVRAYEEYRAQPLLNANGQPVLVPVISVADIFSDQAAMLGEQSKPNPSRMRPATNADWINPLVDAANLASMAIAPELKIAGSAAEAVDAVEVSANAAEGALATTEGVAVSGRRAVDRGGWIDPPGLKDIDPYKLQPYGGRGGGHHVPAQRAFTGADGYDPNTALAISNIDMKAAGIKHSIITGAQKKMYCRYATTGNALTWGAVKDIETKALVAGGADPARAAVTVDAAIANMQARGIAGPKRIPWGRTINDAKPRN